MAAKKYVADYRLENQVDGKTGKVKTVAVYRGDWYSFTADKHALGVAKWRFGVGTGICVFMLLTVLFLNAPCGHMAYVMPPFAVMVFPVYFLGASCFRLFTAKERFTREHNDKMYGRFTGSCIAILILAGLSAVGHIVYFFLNPVSVKDAVSLVATALMLASAAMMFKGRSTLKAQKRD